MNYTPQYPFTWNSTDLKPYEPPKEVKSSKIFTISWDTKEYDEALPNGYSKGDSEKLNCFKVGNFYIMWGTDES